MGWRPDTLLLLEHPHVYTLGRRGKASDVLATPWELSEIGADVHYVDRGAKSPITGRASLWVIPSST